jgi:predicted NAD-dependent protein-ADP-ribosyltransferase YbiA (DUF1768 family)
MAMTEAGHDGDDAEFVYFYSNAVEPYYQLSNFYQTMVHFKREHVIPEMLRYCPKLNEWLGEEGRIFPSSEHVWQSLKARDLATFLAFVQGGRFADMLVFFQAFYQNVAARSNKEWFKLVAQKCTFWGRKNMVGIAAKMAAEPKNAFKLGLLVDNQDKMDYRLERLTPAVERAIWLTILRQKIRQNAAVRAVLMGIPRGQRLIEFDRGAAQRKTHWGGLWDAEAKCVIGENFMGQYLMAVRTELVVETQ